MTAKVDPSTEKSEPAPLAEARPAAAVPPAPPEIDQAAVAQAEADLDAASRDRARADERAAQAAGRLSAATSQAALDAARARKLAFLVRDPSTRITQASSRGGFVRGERDKIQKEISTLRQLPRPKSVSILSKAPVAKPASGNEYHFELRRNRITYIDLDRLMEKTRADAQIRIRMSDRSPAVSNKIGPVGAFSLEYELVRAVPGSMEELIQAQEHPIRAEWLGARTGVGEPGGDVRIDPRPALRVFAHDQSVEPRAVDHHSVGLSRQLHPVPADPRRPHRSRIQRRRPPPARRHDHPRQPDGHAIGGAVSRVTESRQPIPRLTPPVGTEAESSAYDVAGKFESRRPG